MLGMRTIVILIRILGLNPSCGAQLLELHFSHERVGLGSSSKQCLTVG